MAIPRLFIGSSHESLPLAQVLAEKLSMVADVDIWNDVFKSQQTYLGTLLGLPELYDFGAFLLGPDDSIVSGAKEQYIPRDNVIFELGLFMQVLGVKRAFPVVPDGVKICSDFSGWKQISYKEPAGWKMFRRSIEEAKDQAERQSIIDGYKAVLAPLVQSAAAEIGSLIRDVGINHSLPVHPVASSVLGIWPRVEELIFNAIRIGPLHQRARVQHLALDMAEAWNILRDGILENDRIRHLTWHCLMIDPDSSDIVEVQSDSVSTEKARLAISNIQQMLAEPVRKRNLETRDVEVVFRKYKEPPTLHGFMIEGQGLLLSMCGMDAQGRLNAARTPYFRFGAREESHPHHVVSSFHDWFEFHWKEKRSLPI